MQERQFVLSSGCGNGLTTEWDRDNQPTDPSMPSLFDPVVPEARLHPSVQLLRNNPGAEPTRRMMDEVFASMRGVDGNFVDQFQTTGFDARVFELFLNAYVASFADVNRVHERPDFMLTSNGQTVAVEATTANPTQVPGVPQSPLLGIDMDAPEEPEERRLDRINNEIPIRFGSALYSKLKKRYWLLPHVAGKPLVLAIQGFHAHDALLFSSSGLLRYVYGLTQEYTFDENARLVTENTPVTSHQLGAKVVPSGFFALPEADNISAVIFSNAGSVSKFTRMGFQAGLHRGNVIVTRIGAAYDSDPNAVTPRNFAYRLDENPGIEPWGSGVEVAHNPGARHPLPHEFFVDAVQWFLDENGALTSLTPDFTPISSVTQRLHLAFPSLTPVEDSDVGVGTILRREFDDRPLARPDYSREDLPFGEVAWFADHERRVLGTVLRFHGQEEYGLVVLGPDEHGVWRAIEQDGGFTSLDEAAKAILRRLAAVSATGATVFPQD